MMRWMSVLAAVIVWAGAPAYASYMEENVDRPGNDLRSFPLTTPNVGQCKQACDGDAQCQAWTYVRPGVQSPNAMCWLKAFPGAPRASNCCISGLKNAAADPASAPFRESCAPLKPMGEVIVSPRGTWLTDVTGWRFLQFAARGYAETAKRIVRDHGYTEMCSIGRMTYFFAPGWRDPGARGRPFADFDCIRVNPSALTIIQDGDWMLLQGGTIVQRGFASRQEAEWGRQAMLRYGFTERCSFRDMNDTGYWH